MNCVISGKPTKIMFRGVPVTKTELDKARSKIKYKKKELRFPLSVAGVTLAGMDFEATKIGKSNTLLKVLLQNKKFMEAYFVKHPSTPVITYNGKKKLNKLLPARNGVTIKRY